MCVCNIRSNLEENGLADSAQNDEFDHWDTDGELIDLVRGNIYAKELEKRIKHTPIRRGRWIGEKGTSIFEITDSILLDKLKKYKCKEIHYDEYAEPNFSEYAVVIISIENMGHSRRNNFRSASEQFLISDYARKFNITNKKDFNKYKKDNKLSWHECSDGVTMMLLPRIIHQTFTHCGGVSEYGEVEKQEAVLGTR